MHNYIPASAYLQLVGACSGTFPGGKAAAWVAGLVGNIAITAQLELELGMSLTMINISLYCHYTGCPAKLFRGAIKINLRKNWGKFPIRDKTNFSNI